MSNILHKRFWYLVLVSILTDENSLCNGVVTKLKSRHCIICYIGGGRRTMSSWINKMCRRRRGCCHYSSRHIALHCLPSRGARTSRFLITHILRAASRFTINNTAITGTYCKATALQTTGTQAGKTTGNYLCGRIKYTSCGIGPYNSEYR